MNRTSLEKSLAFLAPSLVKDKKKKKVISPVKVPDHNEEDLLDIESLLRGDEELSEEEVKSQEEYESEEEVRSEKEYESEEEVRSEKEYESEDEVKSQEEDRNEEEVRSQEEYESEEEVRSEEEIKIEDEEEEIEIKTLKGIQTLTPKRFKIKLPKSPVLKKDITEITEKVNSFRYNVIKFVFNEENSIIDYVICFDPNGEIVFVQLDKEKVKVFDEEKIIKINYKDETNTMSSSFIEGIKNKITYDVYGMVFFDGVDYLIMKRNSEGEMVSDFYTTVDTQLDKKVNIPFVYSIVKLSYIIKHPVETIRRTKQTYQIIQTQQINTNRGTIRNLMETTKELTDKIYHFDRVYKKVTKDIVSDWKTLSTYSSEYYDKFHEDDLTDEDKESFDQVTVNMFVRFQIFNEQVENVNNLYKAIDRINHSIFTINETVLKLEEKNEKIRNRIIEIDEMEEYV